MFHILNIENIMMATRFLNFKPELSCIPPGPGPNEMYGSSESYEVGGELETPRRAWAHNLRCRGK